MDIDKSSKKKIIKGKRITGHSFHKYSFIFDVILKTKLNRNFKQLHLSLKLPVSFKFLNMPLECLSNLSFNEKNKY